MPDWQVTKPTHHCARLERALEVGETYYSGLLEEGDSFVRLDFSVDAWQEEDKTPFFSYWKTRVQSQEEKKKKLVIDAEAFYTFFLNLLECEEESKQLFRYLVALILVRKRILRLDEIEKGPEGDSLMVYDRRTEKTYTITCPEATEERLEEAQGQLNEIFECQVDL